MRLTTLLAMPLLLLASGITAAATYCVSTGAEFISALEQAAASDDDDVIRLNTASISLPESVNVSIRGSLSIRGGYRADCLGQFVTSRTQIHASSASDVFRLEPRLGDLTLSRLNFNGFSSLTISDHSTPSAVRSGEIVVERCAFVDNGSGLSVVAHHHDVRVENSLFLDSSNASGNILSGAGFALRGTPASSPVTEVLLVNNSAVGNRIGFAFETPTDGSAATSANVTLFNNVLYGNRSRDLILRRAVLARHNIWVSENFEFGGSLSAGSNGNLAVDPELDANHRPITPHSPAINSGHNNVPGGLPARDHGGSPRLVGTRVDRGAFESNVNDSPLLAVTNLNNSGSGSLRQAMLDANTSPQEKTIVFDIPGGCPRVIIPTASLPVLTAPVVIDGYSQPGSQHNQSMHAFDGTLCVTLDGNGLLGTGLHFDGGSGESMRLEGLAFYGFTSEAVLISGQGSVELRGNAFGTGAAGHSGAGFVDAAIRVQDAVGTLIGGADVAARNVIGRADQVGIRLEGSDAGRTVRGNLIGLNADGSTPLSNDIGVTVAGSTGDVITRNRIGFNLRHGVRMNSGAAAPQQVIVSSNDFGLAADLLQAAPQGVSAVRVEGGEDHFIEYNSITNSGTDGIVVLSAARRVRFSNNAIWGNAQQAIDLSPNGVNPIGLDVGAVGANDQQNYPTLLEASGGNQSGRVRGVLESKNGSFLVQIFRTNECDADGFGEAGRWIGQAQVTISNAGPTSNGSAVFEADVVSGPSMMGRAITAITTDSEGNSSEVSACITYQQGTTIFEDGFE